MLPKNKKIEFYEGHDPDEETGATERETINDWQWLVWMLEQQKNWHVPNGNWFAENGDRVKTFALLNQRLSQLNTNLEILERIRLKADTAAKAKLVYKVLRQTLDSQERCEAELDIIRKMGEG